MLLLGIDLGTSSVKVAVVDGSTGKTLSTVQHPEIESPIIAEQTGWAEQSPEQWWVDVQQAILKSHTTKKYDPKDIKAVGIAYQMHGLVVVDKNQNILRNSIIWCDSRAVEIGEKAFHVIGEEKCLTHLLNSPGNFTASKLAWVKENEPPIFERIDKVMLPGDFIAMKLTGSISTSISALSEGVFWDFKSNEVSKQIFQHFQFPMSFIPSIKNVFELHGVISDAIAEKLGLGKGVQVTYKAGDQPNNALSLNVLNPGEVAATAGTSGVIYSVSDELVSDRQSRINTFAHVNHTAEKIRTGILLCINGTGSINRWVRQLFAQSASYRQMNDQARAVSIGSDGLRVIPFGNGAERMLNNKLVGAHLVNIDLNKHTSGQVYRATQEGIACAMRFGLDIMRDNGIFPSVIRAGHANLFLSDVFVSSFVNITQTPVELMHAEGCIGAALGAGIGSRYYQTPEEAFQKVKTLQVIEPNHEQASEELYQSWKSTLQKFID
jgi:xylulokinase